MANTNIKGFWTLNNGLEYAIMSLSQNISVKINETEYSTLYYSCSLNGTEYIQSFSAENSDGSLTLYDNVEGWANDAYRVLDFGANGQNVSEDFYAFMVANCESAEEIWDIYINLSSQNGIRLDTSGTRNRGDIYITPVLDKNRSVTPSKETQTLTPAANTAGMAKVTVNPIPSDYVIPEGTMDITQNVEKRDVTNVKYVKVNVTPQLEELTVDPTNVDKVYTPSEGYVGFSQVTVHASTLTGEDNPLIAETSEVMAELLSVNENAGKVVQYTGESDESYDEARLYVLEVDDTP